MKRTSHPIGVIGAGISGLAAAITLASRNVPVTIFEKHGQPGGRARQFKEAGFTFDMGPSWYWMPDIFETFFERFGKRVTDYYSLQRLDPSYQVIYENSKSVDIPASLPELFQLFDAYDPGSAKRLEKFLENAEIKYKEAIYKFVWKPSLSAFEFADPKLLISAYKLNLFSSISGTVQKITNHPLLKQILEFPVLFLGAKPEETPALYSMMNYADMCLGTWYPMGGMYEMVKALEDLALEMGVRITYNTDITGFDIEQGIIQSVVSNGRSLPVSGIIASADYAFVDQQLLPPEYRNYSSTYWEKRKMAPSALLFYIGTKRKIPGLRHHNLFFDADFDHHANQIYDYPAWPDKPLFYVCAPSKTDPTVAPEGKENLFILIPLAAGLDGDNEAKRIKYLLLVSERMKKLTGTDLIREIEYLRHYSVKDFKADYNAYKGNAYGLANTLKQTAFLKPRIVNKHLSNLYYTGQLSVPGPGVPPSLISGQIVADYLMKTTHQQHV